jgi:hypothetical protein
MIKTNRKTLIIIAAIAALALIVAGAIYWFTTRSTPPDTSTAVEEVVVPKKRISAPQNVIAMEQRPVVRLQPFSRDGGRFLRILINEVRQSATMAEYELVYNVVGANAVSAGGAKIATPDNEAAGGLQAFVGEIELATLPAMAEGRFGTCSAGGACINHNVDFGLITLNFDAAEKYGVNGNWTYFESGQAANQTTDEQLTITAPELATSKDYLIAQMLGLPSGVPGTPAMIPDPESRDGGTKPLAYQLNFTTAPKLSTAQVTFTASTPGSQIAVYDGANWSIATDSAAVPIGDGYIYALVAAAGT